MDEWRWMMLGGTLGVIVWGMFQVIGLLRGIDKRLGHANELLSSISRATGNMDGRTLREESERVSKAFRGEPSS